VKIGESTSIKSYGAIRKKLKSGSSQASAFSDILSAVAGGTSASSETATVSNAADVGSLLSLQEVSEEDYNRKKTLQHGFNLLQSLEALRQSLLLGAVPYSVLKTLESRLTQQRLLTADPELLAIIDDIELR